MNIDCIFSGGGVKAFSFIGALKCIEENHFTIKRVGGVSAGAIVSALIAAGYLSDEIKEMADKLNPEELLDLPFFTKIFPLMKGYTLYKNLGIYKGDRLEEWLFQKLSAKGVFTFQDLPHGSLKIIISDLTKGKLIVAPDDLEEVYGINGINFPVARAVRMSATFPYFFIPKYLLDKNNRKCIIVDGGILSNFPLWLFQDEYKPLKRPLLGIRLLTTGENNSYYKINNAFAMLQALFSTMKTAHDDRYVSLTEEDNILSIRTQDIQAMDMQISEALKMKLFEEGYQKASRFLKHWP